MNDQAQILHHYIKPQKGERVWKPNLTKLFSAVGNATAGGLTLMAGLSGVGSSLLANAVSDLLGSVQLERTPAGLFHQLLMLSSEVTIARFLDQLREDPAVNDNSMVIAVIDDFARHGLGDWIDRQFPAVDPATFLAKPEHEQRRAFIEQIARRLKDQMSFLSDCHLASLPRHFTNALDRVWGLDPAHYQRMLLQSSSSPVADTIAARMLIRAHNDENERHLDDGLFSGSEFFGLREIHVPLHFHKSQLHERFSPDSIMSDDQGRADEGALNSLEQLCHTLLGDQLAGPWLKRVLFVRGGPGSGKTTSARMAASALRAQSAYDDAAVFFITLKDAVIDETHLVLSTERCPELDPIVAFSSSDYSKALIFLDGVDELGESPTGKAYRDALFAWVVRTAKMRSSIRFVLLGRDAAMQTNPPRELADVACHSVLPLAANRADVERGLGDRVPDLRGELWSRFCALRGLSSDAPPEFFDDEADKTYDLTVEPLLLYLLLRRAFQEVPTLEADELAEDACRSSEFLLQHGTKSALYADLFKSIHTPEHRERAASDSTLGFGTWLDLLGCIAIAAWHGRGGREATVSDYRRFACALGFGASAEELLEALGTKGLGGENWTFISAFYFAKANKGAPHDQAGDTFEFTHKSFGDYLAARMLFRIGLELARGDRDDTEAITRWAISVWGAEYVDDFQPYFEEMVAEAEVSSVDSYWFFKPADEGLWSVLDVAKTLLEFNPSVAINGFRQQYLSRHQQETLMRTDMLGALMGSDDLVTFKNSKDLLKIGSAKDPGEPRSPNHLPFVQTLGNQVCAADRDVPLSLLREPEGIKVGYLSGLRFRGVVAEVDWSNIIFERCLFERCTFSNLVLTNCRFYQCQFLECHFGETEFKATTVDACFFVADELDIDNLADGGWQSLTLEDGLGRLDADTPLPRVTLQNCTGALTLVDSNLISAAVYDSLDFKFEIEEP